MPRAAWPDVTGTVFIRLTCDMMFAGFWTARPSGITVRWSIPEMSRPTTLPRMACSSGGPDQHEPADILTQTDAAADAIGVEIGHFATNVGMSAVPESGRCANGAACPEWGHMQALCAYLDSETEVRIDQRIASVRMRW